MLGFDCTRAEGPKDRHRRVLSPANPQPAGLCVNFIFSLSFLQALQKRFALPKVWKSAQKM
ncbi:hypothetical protein SAMN05192539_1018129 [Paraburkholderia diazotrophica]|uniref:Uncharacterized protein n=1 Tax=Paraburkholderia diazotrophica TaxID=667676 RepID=A0A1H7BTU1_9BURK|nr:hypothetical protein SAMN05192539_1018129 [Paraburkholderia diazotrophica]